MTLENIKKAPVEIADAKGATAGIAGTIVSDNAKLFPEVLKMVQNLEGGASGLVKQFRDRGLSNVATSLTAKDGIQTITPEQIVQGLGMEKIDALATASGLDVKIVRKELVTVLPKVLQQLGTTEKVVETLVAPVANVEAVAVAT
jgi:uncharacterized protein YidB (DUF937 family)